MNTHTHTHTYPPPEKWFPADCGRLVANHPKYPGRLFFKIPGLARGHDESFLLALDLTLLVSLRSVPLPSLSLSLSEILISRVLLTLPLERSFSIFKRKRREKKSKDLRF